MSRNITFAWLFLWVAAGPLIPGGWEPTGAAYAQNDPFSKEDASGGPSRTPRVVDPQAILAKRISYQSTPAQSNVKALFQYIGEFVPDVNFVVTPEAARLSLPELDFKNLSLQTIFRLLPQITNQRISVDYESITQNSEDENMVVLVGKQDHEEPLETRVLSIKQLLSGMDKATLMEAIDDGLKFIGSDTQPEIGFHEKTGLLFVRGTPQQTQFLMEMVSAMQGHQGYAGYYGGGMGGMGGFGPGMGMGGMGGGMPPGGYGAGAGGGMMGGYPGVGGIPGGGGGYGGGGAEGGSGMPGAVVPGAGGAEGVGGPPGLGPPGLGGAGLPPGVGNQKGGMF
jgi:hypothetical protein